jgi:hypothetical protein
MPEAKLTKELCMALDLLPELTNQLKDAGYDMCDGEGVWSFRDDPPGYWAAGIQPDEDGHLMLVVSIHGANEADWGLSYASTLCGECCGTCYWSGRSKTQLGFDDTWQELGAAVLKARSLLQRELEGGND